MLFWFSGEQFSTHFLLLLMFSYITQVLLIMSFSSYSTLKYFFYTKYVVLSYSIDIVITLPYCLFLHVIKNPTGIYFSRKRSSDQLMNSDGSRIILIPHWFTKLLT